MKDTYCKTGWHDLRYRRIAASWIIVPCIALLFTVVNIAPANSRGSRPHCEVCRRFTDTSPAQMDVSYRFGKHVKIYKICSFFCYLEFIEDFSEHVPISTRAVNFSSWNQEGLLFINANRGYFLYGVEGDEQKTHEPYSVAFNTESQAETAQKELGGEIMRFEELVALVKKLTDEYEPEEHGPRHSPNKRPGR